MFKYTKENNDNKDSKAADYLQQWKISGDKYKMASRYLYNEGSAEKYSRVVKSQARKIFLEISHFLRNRYIHPYSLSIIFISYV